MPTPRADLSGGVDVAGILRATGALLEGHFLLTSGRHSPQYFEKFRVLQRPQETAALCSLIAHAFRDAGAQAVAGPTLGGVIISYEVARLLGVRAVYAEPGDEKTRVFRRDFETVHPGERVLVVDDILTTGGSVNQVIAAVRRAGGQVIGVGLLVDRTDGAIDFGVPCFACERRSVPSYAPDACPQCAAGLPLIKPGGGVNLPTS
ncbi:MAG: orotate phosphoribosyltransferase [Chloroflexi bacterium]|nr:orotate phosphoribosyltransferase [Chloroflexota bacterium]